MGHGSILLLLALSAPAGADEPLQVACVWRAPGTTPVHSYTLHELDYGTNRFDNANASLAVAGLGASLNPVLNGFGPPSSEAPPPTVATLRGLPAQKFYDEGVTYTRRYSLSRISDDEPCSAYDTPSACHYVTELSLVIDTCVRPLPLIVLFPTGAGATCYLQNKRTRPASAIVPNQALPWENAAPSVYVNGWTAERETAQRARCGVR